MIEGTAFESTNIRRSLLAIDALDRGETMLLVNKYGQNVNIEHVKDSECLPLGLEEYHQYTSTRPRG